MFIPVIKAGINTVHKNWQLILIQLISMIIICMSFFIIVGLPIATAFIMFGLDFTEILKLKDIVSAFKWSAELLSKYFAMAVVIILSLLLYIAFIAVLWVFTISGTVGVIAKSILNEINRFTLKTFFAEGRRMFLSVFVFSAIIGFLFIALAFILGILGGVALSIIDLAKTQEAALGIFLGVFFSLILLTAGILLILITLSITVYGIAYMTFNKLKPLKALMATVKYLYSTPSSIGFYSILLIGYMVIGFIVILIGSPFTLIPVVGPILSLPYQLIAYAIQGYVSLIMLSSVFHYYYGTGYSSIRPWSIGDSDTSQSTEGE
jgi:hypothetical protein